MTTSSSCTPQKPNCDLCNKDLYDECRALILYIARHGEALGSDETNRDAYDELVDAFTGNDAAKLAKSYARITMVLHANSGINGRSVLDTQRYGIKRTDVEQSWRQKCLAYLRRISRLESFGGPRRPMTIGFICFVFALILQSAAGWAGRISDPVKELEGVSVFYYWLIMDLSQILLAGLWGAIGSCLFLMKKLSDHLSSMTYETSRQKGDISRIFVGSFLGIALVELLVDDPSAVTIVGETNLTPNLVALAAGIATKIVYGMIETTIEGIAKRISGDKRSG